MRWLDVITDWLVHTAIDIVTGLIKFRKRVQRMASTLAPDLQWAVALVLLLLLMLLLAIYRYLT